MGATLKIAFARIYTTPKDPQTEPKTAANFVKGQSADSPDASANNDVAVPLLLLTPAPRGIERIKFSDVADDGNAAFVRGLEGSRWNAVVDGGGATFPYDSIAVAVVVVDAAAAAAVILANPP